MVLDGHSESIVSTLVVHSSLLLQMRLCEAEQAPWQCDS